MSKTQSPIQIPGYTYGTSAVAKSPLSGQDFELLKQSALFTDEDVRYLRLAGEAAPGSNRAGAGCVVWLRRRAPASRALLQRRGR